GFDDEVFALAKLGGGAGLVDLATNDERGVEVCGAKDRSDHRSRGGLAVRASDGDAVLEAHQLSEHFGAGNDGNLALVSFDDFGVVEFDGGRRDNNLRAFDIRCFVALKDSGAQVLQTLGDV